MSAFSRPSQPAHTTGNPQQSAPPVADPLLAAYTGPAAQPRIDAVRRSLDRSLDEWWRRGALPAPPLLRDGLLLLEAGNSLDEAQRSLLLRAALAHRRGLLTALRHQTDPERTAVILAEAVMAGAPPLPPAELAQLAHRDGQGDEWQPPLILALQQDAAHPDPAVRARVTAALAALTQPATGQVDSGARPEEADDFAVVTATPGAEESSAGRPWLRFALLLTLLAAAAGVLFWQQRAPADMVRVPAGVYPLHRGAGAAETVELAAFAIDAFEVTNRAYRECVEQQRCAWPAATASATRQHYFLDPAFADYPVVQVDWASAADFCAFVGKRLPSAAEWEVAATYAPATSRAYRYPWGDQFLVQAANSAALGLGDTTAAGAYRPTGDSPLGLADMAGNVAEWTATAASTGGENGGEYTVKGGSFLDPAPLLLPAAVVTAPASRAADWLGFRCAASSAP